MRRPVSTRPPQLGAAQHTSRGGGIKDKAAGKPSVGIKDKPVAAARKPSVGNQGQAQPCHSHFDSGVAHGALGSTDGSRPPPHTRAEPDTHRCRQPDRAAAPHAKPRTWCHKAVRSRGCEAAQGAGDAELAARRPVLSRTVRRARRRCPPAIRVCSRPEEGGQASWLHGLPLMMYELLFCRCSRPDGGRPCVHDSLL